MAPNENLSGKLRWIFIRQAIVASLVVVVGTYLGSLVLRDALLKQRMMTEANAAWAQVDRGDQRNLRKSVSFQVFFVPAGGMPDNVPAPLRTLTPGMHKMPGKWRLALVSERAAGRVYLLMAPGTSDRLVFWMSVLAGSLAVLGIGLISLLGYRRSMRVVAPVARLSEAVLAWDPRNAPSSDLRISVRPDANTYEVAQLGDALASMAERVQAYVERERDFTRDASHELRTPLTVIRVASDLLAAGDLDDRGMRSVRRIQSATRDMGEVLDAFLILARHPDVPVDSEPMRVLDIAHEEAANTQDWLEGKPVEVEVVTHAAPEVQAPPRVIGHILSQFLRNACRFTESGRIAIEVEADAVHVRDTGIGMDADAMARAFDPFWRADISDYTAKGMGLTVARRLAERFGWHIGLQSEPGKGTVASLVFRPPGTSTKAMPARSQ